MCLNYDLLLGMIMPAKIELILIDGLEYKKCTICKNLLPIDYYHKRGLLKSGTCSYKSACKKCHSEDGLSRYRIKKKEHPLSRKQSSYRYTIKTYYSLSEQDFNNLHENQDMSCKICLIKINNVFKDYKGANVAVDHCHDTGKVRGLLCRKCNSGIGLLKDSPKLLKRALIYLEEA